MDRPAPPVRAGERRAVGDAGGGGRFSAADLDAALAHYDQLLDVDRDNLERLLQFAEAAAYERDFGRLSCADVMFAEPIAVKFGTGLDEAWALMRRHRVKALPVIDRTRRVIGIVTVGDFMRHVDPDARDGLGDRLRALIRHDGAVHSSKPEAVGRLMTRRVRVASASGPVSELVPLFSQDGHHHIPVIDAEQHLVGILAQSDPVRAWVHGRHGAGRTPTGGMRIGSRKESGARASLVVSAGCSGTLPFPTPHERHP